AAEAGLLVVPEDEPDRAPGHDVGATQDAGQLHHQRRPGAVVVGRGAVAVAVHVAADDVHLLRVGAADLGAVHLLARTRRVGLGVDPPERGVGLQIGIQVHAGGPAGALARPRRPGRRARAGRRGV